MLTLHASRIPGREAAGFTLIELLVACFILLIAGGMAMKFMTEGFNSENKAVSEQKAESKAAHAMDVMGNDLRSARSPGRDTSAVSDLELLRQGVLFNRPLRNAQTGAAIDIRDVIFASPSILRFRADVVPSASGFAPAAECVEYRATTTTGLRRRVTTGVTGNACTGTLLSDEVLLPAQT